MPFRVCIQVFLCIPEQLYKRKIQCIVRCVLGEVIECGIQGFRCLLNNAGIVLQKAIEDAGKLGVSYRVFYFRFLTAAVDIGFEA